MDASLFSRDSTGQETKPGNPSVRHLAQLAKLLPCHPCPHTSACCRRGVSVTEGEASAIVAAFGSDTLVWNSEEGAYRTRVVGQRCVFYKAGGCDLHDSAAYPRLCLNYPWFGMDGQVYEYEVDLCPEMLIRPNLSALLDDSRRHLRPTALQLVLEGIPPSPGPQSPAV